MFQRLKAEFLDVLSAVVFFVLAANLINITHALLFHRQQIALLPELHILIGATVVRKVLALADLLPIMNVFHGEPLIYATLWKTSIYSFGALLYRYCDFLAPYIVGGTVTELERCAKRRNRSRCRLRNQESHKTDPRS